MVAMPDGVMNGAAEPMIWTRSRAARLLLLC